MSKAPKTRPLSKREIAWIKRLQRTLDACPNKRLGFFTIGDPDVTIYDRRFDDQINKITDERETDFCIGVDELEASLSNVCFPSCVHSVAG